MSEEKKDEWIKEVWDYRPDGNEDAMKALLDRMESIKCHLVLRNPAKDTIILFGPDTEDSHNEANICSHALNSMAALQEEMLRGESSGMDIPAGILSNLKKI